MRIHVCIYIYTGSRLRVSPGRNYFMLKLILKMLILYCFFTVFYGFESVCMTIENVTCCADKLQVHPRRNILMFQLYGKQKNLVFFPKGVMVSCICCRLVDY